MSVNCGLAAIGVLVLVVAGGCGGRADPEPAGSGGSETIVALAAQTPSGVAARVRVARRDGQTCMSTRAGTRGPGPEDRRGTALRICTPPSSVGERVDFLLVRAHGRSGGVLIANHPRRCSRVGIRARDSGRAVSSACQDVDGERLAMLVLPSRGPALLDGLGALRRFSAAAVRCSRDQGVCVTELDRRGRPRW